MKRDYFKILTFILFMGFLSKIFGQSEPKDEYQPNWDFYFSNVNDKLSSISTDLNLTTIAPIKRQENVIYISIKMPNPKDNGLSSKKDANKLWEIEDEIIDRLNKKNLNYTFVGRLTSNGFRDLRPLQNIILFLNSIFYKISASKNYISSDFVCFFICLALY